MLATIDGVIKNLLISPCHRNRRNTHGVCQLKLMMIKRILLIDIDVFWDGQDTDSYYYSHHPVGLLYLVAAARAEFPDIEFRVFHTSTSTDPLTELASLLGSFQPGLVGLRALSVAQASFRAVAQKIRQMMPGIPLIGGGPYASSSYAEILKEGLVDLAVIGEGELTFNELLRHLSEQQDIPQQLAGTAALVNDKVRLNPPGPVIQNLDALPFPAYDLVNLKDYEGIKNLALQDSASCAFIIGSRGCPYGCFYCHQLFGKKIRRRSPENILAEMREHIEKRGIHDFVFLDDIFNVPMNEAKELLSRIIRELPPVRLNFPNGLRADFLDEELLDLFEQAGTVEMALAVESAVPRLQKLMGKNLNIEKASRAIQSASRRFITRVFFIIGFPTETYEEALQTINLAASFEYSAQPMLSVLRLYNNSRLFDLLQPTKEQLQAIAEQEQQLFHLELFRDVTFYGDLFPAEKVPLKSSDLKELLYQWMRDVLINPARISKSHQVVRRHLDKDKTLEFYRNVFKRPTLTERELEKFITATA